jgi:hypothetical protein
MSSTASDHERFTVTSRPDEGNVVWTQRGDDMSWREIDDEVIVLDLRSATYLRLNPSGALFWRRLETGTTDHELVEILVDRFALTVEQAHGDVVSFIDSCLKKDLIKPKQL